jgi:peroxiredoxin
MPMNASKEASAGTLEARQGASRTSVTAITAALVVSVALNVLLAYRLRSVNAAQEARIAEYQLKIGTTVPPISAKGLDGQREVISYQGANQPTVLYVFTPPCSWCARNIDNFKTLLDKRGSQYRFIGLSLSEEGLTEYVRKNDLVKLPVYSSLSTETGEAYKLSGTPQTIVVSPEGRVLQSWMGAYIGDQKSQVEAYFHVTLPGIRPGS